MIFRKCLKAITSEPAESDKDGGAGDVMSYQHGVTKAVIHHAYHAGNVSDPSVQSHHAVTPFLKLSK